MRRLVYLGLFVILGGTAALLTLRAQHTVAVVVATRDIRSGTQVESADVEVRLVHLDALPDGTLTTTAAAVGRYVAWPLTAGEPVLARALDDHASGAAAIGGLPVPAGYRAVAVPVDPADAVGGVLTPGDRVDVFGTPKQGRVSTADTTVSTAPAATGDGTTELGSGVLVLQLRTADGAAMDASSGDSVHGLNFGSTKLGAVVLAVPADEVATYASASASDSIYLALAVS